MHVVPASGQTLMALHRTVLLPGERVGSLQWPMLVTMVASISGMSDKPRLGRVLGPVKRNGERAGETDVS